LPLVHTFPQPPQLAGSLSVCTQMPEHICCLPTQAHCESWQFCPPGHLLPQAPQLATLLAVFTHKGGVPHSLELNGHVHAPAWQMRPPVHATPHAPQLSMLV
jgi:hypothetical protein